MDSESEPKINEALELALAAIDKEALTELQPTILPQQQQQPQQQPENSYPITAQYNNNVTTEIISNNDQIVENNSKKQILKETKVREQQNDLENQTEQLLTQNVAFLYNKTDEEKCENLKMEENCSICLEIQEKSEEEISKEPIYENIDSTTSTKEAAIGLMTTMLASTTSATSSYQQQQIIPSMMSNEQIDHFDSKQYFILENNHINNPNQTQIKLSRSNQLKNRQINNFSCQISSNNSNNNISGENSNKNNNIINNNHINLCNNVIDLTNTFANTTIKATTTTTTITTICSDTPVNKTNISFKENNFNQHLEQPNIKINTTSTIATSQLTTPKESNLKNLDDHINTKTTTDLSQAEPYYQVPKTNEPYYDAPKHLKPIPVYENIEIFYNGNLNRELTQELPDSDLQPPKEKPPPPPIDSPPLFDEIDSSSHINTWSSDNTYETLTRHHINHHNQQQQQHHPHHHHLSPNNTSPPIKRMNSTKRIKKELRNKRSSFLGIEGSSFDDDESYLELTLATPPDMAQLLHEERRLEKQLYLKAGLCDSSDTGESRDSGVSENHSRQSSEHYTNSSEENETHDDDNTSPLTLQTQTSLDPTSNNMIYQNDDLLALVPTPLLQTVKGNSAESWTESATVAAAATQSLTEATATANAKMMSIEEKIREQEEVLRVERELLQLEQEELKRQRENLMLRENMARRELRHGAKMLMSANRRSLQDLNVLGAMGMANMGAETTNKCELYLPQINHVQFPQHIRCQPQLAKLQPQQQPQLQKLPQQIYANIPNLQQQYQMENDYRKSMSDINEFSKRMMSQQPAPPSKPMRTMHINTDATNSLVINAEHKNFSPRQRHSLNSQTYGDSLIKIAAAPTAAPRAGPHVYPNYHHQSVQNLSTTTNSNNNPSQIVHGNSNHMSLYPGNMSRNTLHALSATPKPKYTDGWVQVQHRKSFDSNLANDPVWLSAYQQKRKSMPDTSHGYNQNNHWLVQEAEQRRVSEQYQLQPQLQPQRRIVSSNSTPVHPINNNSLTNGSSTANGKPLPDSIIQTLTERVQNKGIGERKRNNLEKSPLHAASTYQQYQQQCNKLNQQQTVTNATPHRHNDLLTISNGTTGPTNNSTLSSSTTSQVQLNNTTAQQLQQQDKVLSVSGKKKCSHCGDELDLGCIADKCHHTHRELKYIVWV